MLTIRVRLATVGGLIASLTLLAFATGEAQQRASVISVRTLTHDAPETQSVTAEQLRLAVEQAIEARLGATASEVQVRLLDEPDAITVPSGRLDIRLKNATDDVLGRRLLQVGIAVDGAIARTLTLKTDTSAWAEVVTAARHVKLDDVLQTEDLALTRVQLASGRQELLRSVDEAVGKRVTRPMQAHKPIVLSALTEPYAVRRGDRVTIEAKRGALLIQTAGITKGAAQAGDSVTVTNLDSGKEVRARVLGPGLVRVEY